MILPRPSDIKGKNGKTTKTTQLTDEVKKKKRETAALDLFIRQTRNEDGKKLLA